MHGHSTAAPPAQAARDILRDNILKHKYILLSTRFILLADRLIFTELDRRPFLEHRTAFVVTLEANFCLYNIKTDLTFRSFVQITS